MPIDHIPLFFQRITWKHYISKIITKVWSYCRWFLVFGRTFNYHIIITKFKSFITYRSPQISDMNQQFYEHWQSRQRWVMSSVLLIVIGSHIRTLHCSHQTFLGLSWPSARSIVDASITHAIPLYQYSCGIVYRSLWYFDIDNKMRQCIDHHRMAITICG